MGGISLAARKSYIAYIVGHIEPMINKVALFLFYYKLFPRHR